MEPPLEPVDRLPVSNIQVRDLVYAAPHSEIIGEIDADEGRNEETERAYHGDEGAS